MLVLQHLATHRIGSCIEKELKQAFEDYESNFSTNWTLIGRNGKLVLTKILVLSTVNMTCCF